jgi:F-type H+-transporting ATPase subunit gamma
MAANTRQILRRRIRGIGETAKVTRAMEMIASARMRRAEQRALSSRPYALRLRTLMAITLNQPSVDREHPFVSRPEQGPLLVVHFATDKGLCGGLNSRLNQSLGQFVLQQQVPVHVVAVGRKGRDFAVRSRMNLMAEFSGLGDAPGIADLRPLCRLVTEAFRDYDVDRVYLSYPRFVNVVTQTPVMDALLPVDVSEMPTRGLTDILFEPEPVRMLPHLLVRYVEASVYRAYLELMASEYSARMVAMHGATESAKDLAEAMTVELNRSRQAAVTEEICDVSAAVELLSQGAAHD